MSIVSYFDRKRWSKSLSDEVVANWLTLESLHPDLQYGWEIFQTNSGELEKVNRLMKEYGMTDGKVIHLFFVDCSGETKFGKEPLQQYQTFRQIEQTGGGYVQLTGSGLYQQFYKHMISRPNAPYVDPNLTNFDLSPFSYRLDDVITREDITLGPVVAAVKYPWEASFFYFTDVSMYKTEEDLHAGKNEVNLKDFISEWTGNDQDLIKEVCMRCYGAYNFDITQLGDNYENKKVIFIYTEGLFN